MRGRPFDLPLISIRNMSSRRMKTMGNHTIVLVGGRLIDGKGGVPIDDSILVIEKNRIGAVGTREATAVPKGAEIIEVKGMTLMPGLIDAHVHLLGIKSMNPLTWVIEPPGLRGMRAVMDVWKLVDCGFTTIRDCANPNSLYLKRAIEEESIIGPRIVSCGAMITQTGGHGDVTHFLPIEWITNRGLGRVADGADECRKAAREQLREGADFIKLSSTGGVMSEKDLPTSSQYSFAEVKAIVEEAHNVGAKAASHAQGTAGIKNALKAGVDTIEHGFYLDDEAIEMMIKQGSFFTPTLSIVEAIITKGAKAGVPEGSLRKAKSVQEAQYRSFEKARKAGVKILSGTDYLSDPLMGPMGENAIELELMVKAGCSPMEAIVSATKTNAEGLGLGDQLGTIEAGKLADVIVVKGDPLIDISLLRDKENILHVYKNGIKMPRMPNRF
jgi:imidazolonepropionase-like amidohydrolase